jgi:D-alanyl-D-alanine carboxypeptidase
MSASWRAGCPVGLEDLRLLKLAHWGMDEKAHRGELVVHKDHARAMVGVFKKLFQRRFPIERMELVDEYGGDDQRSMRANNTSAFNCRSIASDPSVWSEHAYGRAIDINPLINPFVMSDGAVDPPTGARFADRSQKVPGMIHDDDVVVRSFAAIGWGWGGYWSSGKDYQHFSATGR